MTTDTTTAPQQRRQGYPPLSALRRSRSDRKLVGVAGGLGQWAGVDPLVFRILFVVLAFFGGSGILLYALGWLLVPDEGEAESEGQKVVNGRSTSSWTALAALVVLLLVGLAATGALLDSGPGIGGVGVLAAIVIGVVLVSRSNRSAEAGPPAAGVTPVPYGPVPPPAEPGEYGQTPGTAYTAPAEAPTAPLPPPPGTPGYFPTYAPPPPPKPPAEKSMLGRATLSSALIVVGVLIAWNVATDSDVAARAVSAAALAVVGLGLLVGTFVGRARGLVVWGILLAVLTAILSIDAPSVRGGIGDRTWAPLTEEQLRPTYRLGIGESDLDLSRLEFTGRERVEVRQGIGELTVVIPEGVAVVVDASVGAGELRLPDTPMTDGTDLEDRVTLPGSTTSTDVLVIDAEIGVGSLEVRRATS